ncbi:GNAT family N-acetyltransferase [Rhodopseudomonas palustris]|uniref:GNAT family N-acetyltransferase n=1 Tax=Thiospirillum jenense TaxID=1653858 RepID=A0A839HQ71_9GAMM|nr:GNAT family N-acetyltransferase [Thiospirillum jenense]MBB1093582.1 GNAT family N-acetyltransferase [Rhodopseudomonas palustris]MBB1127262.1 GNAT family N-acetyltransferase [Thiospirillum jenense]
MSLSKPANITLRYADWSHDHHFICALRRRVLMTAQDGSTLLDSDMQDAHALHVLAIASMIASTDDVNSTTQPVATARLLTSGQIERMLVLPNWRGQGIGTGLLTALLRAAQERRYPTTWLLAPLSAIDFYSRWGFQLDGTIIDTGNGYYQRMVLMDQTAMLPMDITWRSLGVTAGRMSLPKQSLLGLTIATLATQTRHTLEILTPDFDPALYDTDTVFDAVQQLALTRRGRLPVRILLFDKETLVYRGQRIIELARRLSSDIQIRAVPDELTEQCDRMVLADSVGYCLTRSHNPRLTLVDFNSAAEVRRLRRHFDQLWESSSVHQALRRLYL